MNQQIKIFRDFFSIDNDELASNFLLFKLPKNIEVNKI